MITDTNIRKIPKYMLKLIQKKDKEFYPKPDGHTRFYTYYTKYNKELCSVTVAVINKYKKWYCKQVIVHGIHSDKVWLQDIGITMGYYVVGWYREKLTTYPKWYDYDWGYNDDKYFNKYTQVINKEFILSQPEYKYSALEQYEYTDFMKYLRLYEQYPQTELLVKCGLSDLATRQTILKKCKKDKNFCKWLYKNKENIKNHYYYTNAILKAYSQNKNVKEVNRLEELKYALRSKDNYRHLKEVFAKDLTKLVEYLVKQDISIPVYEDYLRACEYLGLDMNIEKNRFPKQFMRWHNIRIDEYHTKQAEEDAKIRKELYEKFASVSKKYTNLQRNLKENYVCIIAKSPKDLINEGNTLHHCVGRMGYDQKFAREETLIFFVRTKDNPETPLVTLEYSPKTHKVLQCYAEHDTKPTDAILEFVNKIWLPYANRKIRQIAI